MANSSKRVEGLVASIIQSCASNFFPLHVTGIFLESEFSKMY